MQIAVLSDIHGNYVALEKCVAYVLNRGIDTFIFLGDYLGELAYPQKTMEFLYKLQEKYCCHFIKGNKEDYWINYEKGGGLGWKEIDSTTGALFYTYHQLTQRELEFFKRLPHAQEISFGDSLPMITVCHGSPQKANEKLLPGYEQTFSVMENDPNDLILCGHTHIQGAIEHNGKVVLNAGSVGVPMYSGGKTQFLILEAVERDWRYEFVSLEYDVEQVITDLYISGLMEKVPCWSRVTEHLLRTGEISHGAVLARAMEICREETGECVWPKIPEACWERAVEEYLPAGNTECSPRWKMEPVLSGIRCQK